MCSLKKNFVKRVTDIPKAMPTLILGCTFIRKFVHAFYWVGDWRKVIGNRLSNRVDEVLVMLLVITDYKEVFSNNFWVLLWTLDTIYIKQNMTMYNGDVDRYLGLLKVWTL